MTLGNLVALRQRQAVRLLAWSSVAHAGYLLVPLGAAASGRGTLATATQATLGYLGLYVAMNLGAFGCVTALARRQVGRDPRPDQPTVLLSDLPGLAAVSPGLAVALAFFLLGLAGLPPTVAGLVAKVVIVRAALLGGAGWLAVAVAVNTVIGLAYYLRLASLPFRSPAAGGGGGAPLPTGAAARSRSLVVAICVSLLVTAGLGVVPQLVLGAVPGGR